MYTFWWCYRTRYSRCLAVLVLALFVGRTSYPREFSRFVESYLSPKQAEEIGESGSACFRSLLPPRSPCYTNTCFKLTFLTWQVRSMTLLCFNLLWPLFYETSAMMTPLTTIVSKQSFLGLRAKNTHELLQESVLEPQGRNIFSPQTSACERILLHRLQSPCWNRTIVFPLTILAGILI